MADGDERDESIFASVVTAWSVLKTEASEPPRRVLRTRRSRRSSGV